MNHIYRSIWNDQTGTFVAVSEIGSSKGGGMSGASARQGHGLPTSSLASGVGVSAATGLVVLLALAFSPPSWAAPTGGAVVSGTANIVSAVPNTTTITQTTPKAIIEWQGFGIGAAETVNFQQPDSNSVTLNRVVGPDASGIMGRLSANGKVFLVNPNGILFGPNASVNVGGIVASTLDITNQSFLAGSNEFNGGNTGVVLNQGNITAADGGYVALLGAQVSNDGIIVAKLGTVALASGSAVTLDVANDRLLNVTVTQGALDALAQNGGSIQADGGQVLMTAKSAGALLSTVVNNTGVIRAQTISNTAGKIRLVGDMQNGGVNVAGTLDASAPTGGTAGAIETSASNVKVANGTIVTAAATAPGQTGSWLLNANDLTVAASDGDISNATLANALASTNVELRSSSGGPVGTGNVNVRDAVNWSANNRLTLTATNNVNVGASISATGSNAGISLNSNTASPGSSDTPSGTGKLHVTPGSAVNMPNVSGQAASTALTIDGQAYTVINTLGAPGSITGSDLQGMAGNLSGRYALGGDIDASATAAWNNGEGFAPVGSAAASFTGTFEGLGHTVRDLTIARPLQNYVGLFGHADSGVVIKNVSMAGGSITGNNYVGALAGWITGSTSTSSATQAVTGAGDYVGGLVGWSTGPISDSFATGAVTGTGSYVGGLVGWITGPLNCTYATGDVTGSGSYFGGLAGWVTGDIATSYATGKVQTSGSQVGGLVGWVTGDTANSYATGNVTTAGSQVGGLIGWNTGDVTRSYATGTVTGAGNVGGIVGQIIAGSVTNSFWDFDTSGVAGTAGGGVRMTTADMQQQDNFTGPTAPNGSTTPGWDFANTWIMTNGQTYPLLRPCCAALTTVILPAVTLPTPSTIVAPVLPPAVVVPPPVVVVPPDVALPPVVLPPVVIAPPVVMPPVVPPVVDAPPVAGSPGVVPPSAGVPPSGPAPGVGGGPDTAPANVVWPVVRPTEGIPFTWPAIQPTPPAIVPVSSTPLTWALPPLALFVRPAPEMTPLLNVEPAPVIRAVVPPAPAAAPFVAPRPYIAPYLVPKQERN